MDKWIPVSECTPAENYICLAAWYNHKTGHQFVYESEYVGPYWISEMESEANNNGWEVTHWMHFPEPPSTEDILAVRWQRNRDTLKMAD